MRAGRPIGRAGGVNPEAKTWGHLDSRNNWHHDGRMRTTGTLDRDVERLVREAMHRNRRSFKETLNEGLRAGLRPKRKHSKGAAFVVRARPMGLRAGIDPSGLNKLADELEVDMFLQRSGARRSSGTSRK